MLQFGVPTEMAGIIAKLEQGRDSHGTYSTYFGFDSFMGLPPEDPKTLMPPGGIWREGAYSLVTSTTRTAAYLSGLSKDMKSKALVPEKFLSRHRQPDVSSAVKYWEAQLKAAEKRVRLIPGFYNETLTKSWRRRWSQQATWTSTATYMCRPPTRCSGCSSTVSRGRARSFPMTTVSEASPTSYSYKRESLMPL